MYQTSYMSKTPNDCLDNRFIMHRHSAGLTWMMLDSGGVDVVVMYQMRVKRQGRIAKQRHGLGVKSEGELRCPVDYDKSFQLVANENRKT